MNLRIALIGAGTMGTVHGNALRNVRGASVTAVCDLDGGKAASVAAAHGARVFTDAGALYGAGGFDAVDVCLPTYLHREAALRALEGGMHVFCEKPLALDLAGGGEILRAAARKGRTLSVGQVVRWFPAYRRAVQAVGENRIGTPKLIRTARTGAFPSWGWQDWYGDMRKSGGVLTDLAIHDFDWIRHAFGEVARVYARRLATADDAHGDHCLVLLRLRNGAMAHVEGSWAFPAGTLFGSSFEVIGTAGQIEYDSRDRSPIRRSIADGEAGRFSLESPVCPDQEPYAAELQDFVDSVRESRAPGVPASEALESLKISLAAAESARTGRPVVLEGDAA